jgi:hypothetical protein
VRTADRLLSVLALSGLAACAFVGGAGRGVEVAGTPSPSGCDAWFNLGGRFGPVKNDIQFTLSNKSESRDCRATRVIVLFMSPVRRDAIQVSTPIGWAGSYARCESGDGTCGVVWRSRVGVPAGESVSGFGIQCDSSLLLKIWTVDVGRRRVAMPIGHVGGRVGGLPPE